MSYKPFQHQNRFSSASTLRVGSTRSAVSTTLRHSSTTLRHSTTFRQKKGPTLGDLLAARPTGLVEQETWAILCQSVQALQDLFLSDGASGTTCIPLITPFTLVLSGKGRVKLCQNPSFSGSGLPAHMVGYLAPEYKANKLFSDTEFEKMWIFGLGETLKRATLTSHVATSRLSTDLCQVLTNMTNTQPGHRASLMYLLDVISDYCKKRQQIRPFSHIVMDLHQEAVASLEESFDTPWGPPAMPEIVPRTRNRSSTESTESTGFSTLPRRWMALSKTHNILPRMTREASTSMEDLNSLRFPNTPGKVCRPKSMCVPNERYSLGQNNGNINIGSDRIYSEPDNNNFYPDVINDHHVHRLSHLISHELDYNVTSNINKNNTKHFCNDDTKENQGIENLMDKEKPKGKGPNYRRLKVRRNLVQRSASRLYRTGLDQPVPSQDGIKDCIGPEFVVRASLPTKNLILSDCKGSKREVTVILLDGQKIDVVCSPNSTTAGQLFELIVQKEHIEENFMLGLSTLIAGDFVFLPSDTRICKVIQANSNPGVNVTLFLRVRFFLPSLRGIRGSQARHLLYLQLRRSILEHQLPCSFSQIIELNGLALQAEFGNYSEREHGERDYFLLDHYVPETMICVIDDQKRLREELVKSHISKKGLEKEKAEQDFISFTQNLPHYGGHFYTATWILKDSKETKDIWLYISAQGINLYERGKTTSNFGPQLYENFEWRSIQTLCYSKHYLCILPHSSTKHRSKLKKYKLKMDHKKSYFAFRLASLHHQFFLRLRTEFTSLQSLSQQFGVPLKDIKNETNSLYKLDALTRPLYSEAEYGQYGGSINAETEFKIEFRTSSRSSGSRKLEELRSKSVENLLNIAQHSSMNSEEHQNKENEKTKGRHSGALVLDSSCLAGLPNGASGGGEKRRGVKMGTRAISAIHIKRVSRSMEAVNNQETDYLEQMSLQSVSLHCSSNSISKPSSTTGEGAEEAFILDSTLKSYPNQLLPNFHETLNETLIDKLNAMSFEEERYLSAVQIEKDDKNSLGLKITEGSDGNVYVQSVIPNGPAHLCEKITSGDQIIAVDNQCLLSLNYVQALEILKNTGKKVEFVLSRTSANLGLQLKGRKNLSNISEDDLQNVTLTSEKIRSIHDLTKNSLNLYDVKNFELAELSNATIKTEDVNYNYNSTQNNLDNNSPAYNQIKLVNLSQASTTNVIPFCEDHIFRQNISRSATDSPVEKHLTESCHDTSNNRKYKPADIEDLIDFKTDDATIVSNFKLKSNKHNNDRAIVVDMIPKKNIETWKYQPFLFESDFASNLAFDFVNKPLENVKNDYYHQRSYLKEDTNKDISIANSFNNSPNSLICENWATLTQVPKNVENYTKNAVALPRTMGLSRKWKGPVKYPVTPVKKGENSVGTNQIHYKEFETTSDEEQVFI